MGKKIKDQQGKKAKILQLLHPFKSYVTLNAPYLNYQKQANTLHPRITGIENSLNLYIKHNEHTQ